MSAIRSNSYTHEEKEKDEHHEGGEPTSLENVHFAHMSAEERTAAFQLARSIDPGPATFSMRYLTFFLSCFVAIVCSCDTGFDTTIMSSVNSMTQFQTYFGLVSASTGTGILFVRCISRIEGF